MSSPRFCATGSRRWSVVQAVCGSIVALTFVTPAAAQDASSVFRSFSIGGYLDAYYAYNRNHPATPCAVVNGIQIFNCLHAFDVAQSEFSLNLAALTVEKTVSADSRAGLRVDLGFGSGAELIAGQQSEPNALSKHVQQAYGSYLLSDRSGWRVDVGKFVTPAGFERIDSTQDWNASRSLLFALAIPRDHVGLRTVYVPNSHVAVTGVFANGWSDTAVNPGGKLAGASVSLRPADGFTVTETYLGGTETSDDLDGWRDLSDTVATARLTTRLQAAFNADFGRDRRTRQSWQGMAAYLRYEVNGWIAITPRLESLRDPDGFMTGVAQDLQEATATAEFRPAPGFLMRLEYRVDVADRPYFLKSVSTTVRTQSIASANCVVFFHSALRKEQ
jgi:Putative beta-barrel porin-2, OmpL-like. bbp2